MAKSGTQCVKVVIASLNEEEGIGLTLKELKDALSDLDCLVIDGNSCDKTVSIAKDFGAEILLQEGTGKGCAISQALDFIFDDPKYIAFIDADFTYPARYIPNMVKILEDDSDVGMVMGNRFNHLLKPLSMKKSLNVGNRLLAFAQHLLNGVDLADPLTGLRIVRWEIIKGWKPRSKDFDIEAEMNFYVEQQGYKIVEIDIPYRPRIGNKKLKIRDGMTILKRIVSESFRYRTFRS